jgi:hypothetical protein
MENWKMMYEPKTALKRLENYSSGIIMRANASIGKSSL